MRNVLLKHLMSKLIPIFEIMLNTMAKGAKNLVQKDTSLNLTMQPNIKFVLNAMMDVKLVPHNFQTLALLVNQLSCISKALASIIALMKISS